MKEMNIEKYRKMVETRHSRHWLCFHAQMSIEWLSAVSGMAVLCNQSYGFIYRLLFTTKRDCGRTSAAGTSEHRPQHSEIQPDKTNPYGCYGPLNFA